MSGSSGWWARAHQAIARAEGLTQEEAAELSGFDYKYYQRIEDGEKNLSLKSLRKLAKALGVEPMGCSGSIIRHRNESGVTTVTSLRFRTRDAASG